MINEIVERINMHSQNKLSQLDLIYKPVLYIARAAKSIYLAML